MTYHRDAIGGTWRAMPDRSAAWPARRRIWVLSKARAARALRPSVLTATGRTAWATRPGVR